MAFSLTSLRHRRKDEVRDPLDPEGYAERVRKSTFPGETFRVLKEKEIRQFGEYRTRRLVLETWECLSEGIIMKVLRLRLKEVKEFGMEYRKFKGKYLVCDLCISAHVTDEKGVTHEVSLCEQFILDTGSPVTIIRQKEFERVCPVPIDDLRLEEVPVGTKRGTKAYKEKLLRIPNLSFPELGLKLEEAFLSKEDRPFSLLGTDFLENFHLVFDPKSKVAELRL